MPINRRTTPRGKKIEQAVAERRARAARIEQARSDLEHLELEEGRDQGRDFATDLDARLASCEGELRAERRRRIQLEHGPLVRARKQVGRWLMR